MMAHNSIKITYRNWKKVFHGFQVIKSLSAEELIQAAESGNIEDFTKLYLADPSRLNVRDSRGRAAAHQASTKNRVNILLFIYNHNGGKYPSIVYNSTPPTSVV
ncbi:hypothetical protein M8J77_023329 [Diaphorina citri]|nr:hypothetical protein M8J77_023329 [Diaphorina citri]